MGINDIMRGKIEVNPDDISRENRRRIGRPELNVKWFMVDSPVFPVANQVT
jgi:hypothetical protein